MLLNYKKQQINPCDSKLINMVINLLSRVKIHTLVLEYQGIASKIQIKTKSMMHRNNAE